MYELTPYERETIINFNDGEKAAELYTASPHMMKLMDDLCENYPERYSLLKENQYSKTYTISDKNDIAFKKPRNISDETRQKLKNNAAIARRNKYYD